MEVLEKGSSSGASDPVADSPRLAALKQQNSKLKYQITHLERVRDRDTCTYIFFERFF